MRFVGFAALVIVALVSCVGKPPELAGTWVLDPSSRIQVPVSFNKTSTSVVLNKDGTFIASSLPGFFLFPPNSIQLGGGTGTWELVTREGHQQVRLTFETTTINEKRPFGSYLYVASGLSGLRLFYFIGDPDDGQRVELVRK